MVLYVSTKGSQLPRLGGFHKFDIALNRRADGKILSGRWVSVCECFEKEKGRLLAGPLASLIWWFRRYRR